MRRYSIHAERYTLMEFLRMTYPRTLMGLGTWILLKTRLKRWQPQMIFVPDSILEATTDIERLPLPAKAYITKVCDDLADHGFVEPMLESSPSTGVEGELLLGTCLRARHVSGMFILQSLLGLHENGCTRAEHQLVAFRDHERTFATTNGRQTLNRIPGSSAAYYPQANLRTLIQKHESRLEPIIDSVIRMGSNQEMARLVDALQERFFRHMVTRGLYTEIDPSGDRQSLRN